VRRDAAAEVCAAARWQARLALNCREESIGVAEKESGFGWRQLS
jgi:hypothetical protein